LPVSLHAIRSDQLPPPVGPFSQAVRAGDFLFLSGQVGLDSSGKLVGGGVEAQAEQIFANLGAVLDAAGKSFADVVRAGVFLTDMADFAALNAVYARHFVQPYPARTTVAVAALPLGAAVEIDLIVKA
jgi:2-iminobutanoate/2-iminopropanoate deaminase